MIPFLPSDQQEPRSRPFGRSEHGNAITLALNWRPLDWCRVTGEVLRVDSWQLQRLVTGDSPHSIDTQGQLAGRLTY